MKNHHPHAEFITEAMQDMSRVIECSHESMQQGTPWVVCSLPEVLASDRAWQFRFKPVRPAVVSTLTDDEIMSICNKSCKTTHQFPRRLVDAAAQAERERICKLSTVTSLSKVEIGNLYSEYDDGRRGLKDVANTAIQRFLQDLAEGKL